MSNFSIKATHKQTGEIHGIACIDDPFGKHKYVFVANVEGAYLMTEDDFHLDYAMNIKAMQERIGKLEEALKPFAKVGSILRCTGCAGLWKATGGENDGIAIIAEDCFIAKEALEGK